MVALDRSSTGDRGRVRVTSPAQRRTSEVDGSALATWIATRVAVAVLALAAGWMVADAVAGHIPSWLGSWDHWDAQLFAKVAQYGYDGYPRHGSPRTCSGDCPAHLHLSWASPCYGTSRLSGPCPWVMVFAVLPADDPATAQPGAPR